MVIAHADPVCGMPAEGSDYRHRHQGIDFFFCSEQCLQRFRDKPHLYIGLPGHPAPRQEGMEVIKRRRLRLARALPRQDEQALREYLQEMMGIKAITITGLDVVIAYDLLQATAEQIEARIARFGAHLGEGWAERLRRAWIHFEEESTLSSLEVSTPWGHGEHGH